MTDDRRFIEDYLPIEAISAEASREKSVRKGHISTLHLWWARRPLVACRAAVYGALVPATQFVPDGASDEKKKSLGRANATEFITSLCQYPGSPQVIKEGQAHILKAHAERLSTEQGKTVAVEDILSGRAQRPRVLDMFAGGGAIPLEALRLGCEAYALDLNPVAHVIQRRCLSYPQRFGQPDQRAYGMTGPKNVNSKTTWGGLANEVRYWGTRVLNETKATIGQIYPPVPDPDSKYTGCEAQTDWLEQDESSQLPTGHLLPLAYLWTRTVCCLNPQCGGTVPLFKQTWLHANKPPYIALRPVIDRKKLEVRFQVSASESPSDLGFDPEEGSYRGTTTCPFCGSAVPNTYVMEQGTADRVGHSLMCVVAQPPSGRGRKYIGSGDTTFDLTHAALGSKLEMMAVSEETTRLLDIDIPSDRRESFWCRRYGLLKFRQLFTKRQRLFLGACAAAIKDVKSTGAYESSEVAEAVQANLACWLDKLSDYNSSLSAWYTSTQVVKGVFARQALPMVWNFAEINPFSGVMGDGLALLESVCDVIDACSGTGSPAHVLRGSATEEHFPEKFFDAVVTDPPYYDNISYAKLSDFFYIWMRHTVGDTFVQHFTTPGTPKKKEAVVDFARSNGDKERATRDYEELMHAAFVQAHRALKSGGSMVCIYAHRTTLGWSTLVDSLRKAGFTITESWPLDTEMKPRIRAADNASLASSIFLVACKREGAAIGNYEDVHPELEAIVRERVETLWGMGISGADLVIACVGAGLRAFTRFARVEYANGEEVEDPALTTGEKEERRKGQKQLL